MWVKNHVFHVDYILWCKYSVRLWFFFLIFWLYESAWQCIMPFGTITYLELLSEASEPPLFLRRSLLSSRFVLRNFSWRGNPLLPRLQLLRERISARRLRLLPSRCGLLASYLCVLGLVEGRHRSRSKVSFQDPRPWCRGIRAPRRFISLVTRLRTGHVCTGEHFARMGWDLDAGCGCGEAMRSLKHLFTNCPLLSEGRPRFSDFLACRFPGLSPDNFDYRELVFHPDASEVSELGRFFKHGSIINWLSLLFLDDPGWWGLPSVLGSPPSPFPMRQDWVVLITWDPLFAWADFGFSGLRACLWSVFAAFRSVLLY